LDTLTFDRWTRALGERRSRRDIGRLGAGALAALGAGVARTAEGKKKKRKKKKRPQPQGRICPAGEDLCLIAFPQLCGGDSCYCNTGSSATICGDLSDSVCSETEDLCDVDVDCATVTGPGSVCSLLQVYCTCNVDGPQGFKGCVPPCRASRVAAKSVPHRVRDAASVRHRAA
jgi:hypothetical protein